MIKGKNLNDDFAEITHLRYKAGITFNQLAKSLGCSTQWLRKSIYNKNSKMIEKAKSYLYSLLS